MSAGSIGITLSAPSLAALTRGFQEAPAVALRELEGAATVATLMLEGQVKEVYPRGFSNSVEQVYSDVHSSPAGVLGEVGTPSPYGPVIEFGRKPGKWASREGKESLEKWAVFRLGVSAEDAKRVAFLIARKIKRVGLVGKFPFRNTLAKHEADVMREFEDACGRIAAHLAGHTGGAAA